MYEQKHTYTLCVIHTHTFTHIYTHKHTHVYTCTHTRTHTHVFYIYHSILCVNIHTYVSLLCTGPPETSPTDASLVSNMHATTSITITTPQILGALDASHTVPHDSTKTELDSTSSMSSNIQLVYSTAMVSTPVTTTGKPSSHILKNTNVVKPSTTMMTSVATTTATRMVSPTKKSSQFVQNSVSSVLSSTVTPMVSSSTPHPSKLVTATTSSLVLLVYVSTRVAIADGEPCLAV